MWLLSPLSHLYSHQSSVLLIVSIHFLTFFFSQLYQFRVFYPFPRVSPHSGLCILNEVVEYLCFRTLIGSTVLFYNSFSHFVAAMVDVEHGNTCGLATAVTQTGIDHSSDEAPL